MTDDLNFTEDELMANCSPEVAELNRDKLGIATNGPGAPGPCEATVRRKRNVLSWKETEAHFESWVVDLAHLDSWSIIAFRPARTNKGWRTPVKYDGEGVYDLILVRERVVWMEIKSENGKLSQAQLAWQNRLREAGQEAYVMRPSDRPEIERILA